MTRCKDSSESIAKPARVKNDNAFFIAAEYSSISLEENDVTSIM